MNSDGTISLKDICTYDREDFLGMIEDRGPVCPILTAIEWIKENLDAEELTDATLVRDWDGGCSPVTTWRK